MNGEIMEVEANGETKNDVEKVVNGEHLNGVSNGHSKSGDKHRHSSSSHHKSSSSSKDKHRDRDHKSSKSGGHSSSSNKDKHSGDSSNKDKHRVSSSSKSSHRDKDRDKDKSRDKDRHHTSSSSSNKDKDRSKDKDKSSKDKEKSSSGDKEKSSSGDKEKSSSDNKEKSSRDKDRDKDRSRDHKSSSNRDKGKSSSSHDQNKDSRNKDKEKHKDSKEVGKESSSRDDKDKHKSSSSSSKHKHSSSSSSSRHRSDKDRHHSSKSSRSDDHRKSNEIKKEDDKTKIEIKEEEDVEVKPEVEKKAEFVTFVDINAIKNEVKDEKDFMPNISQASSCDYSMSQFKTDEKPFVVNVDEENDNDDDQSQDCSYVNESTVKVEEEEEEDDEDIPIAKRKKIIQEVSDDEDDMPLTLRKKSKTDKKAKKKKRQEIEDEEEEEEYEERPKKKKIKKEKKKETKTVTPVKSPIKGGRKKKEEEPEEVWKWWEEEKRADGVKWNFLEHKGPVFAPAYEPLPAHVTFEYEGQVMRLSQDAEEVACFYAKMLNHDYTSKDIFNDNFFQDWRKVMTEKEKSKITKLKKCNFKRMHDHFQAISEKNKSRTKEEKLAIKTENEQIVAEYGFCTIDGHKEKIGNFRIEPPGLFRGRGEHPKMGLVKRRIVPEDILINCSKDSAIPKPPAGHKWREVKHDNSVTWLASWTENVQGQVKYVMLNPSSKLKGEKDWQKYETARRLHKHIDKIRTTYRDEWKSKEMRIRQRGVALYFIDKLALRAGNEKDEDQADTVGCCSLRVEHIELHKSLNGKENVVVFDFLGKDSIRYYNEVEVEKRVFKNLELFKENKKEGDDLFDRLNTVVMNEHLRELMEGLTAKVFRTYNASWTLQCQLNEMTDTDSTLPEKMLSYNRANRAVAILCNHQRAVPKSHEKSMENLKEKIRAKREQIDDYEVETRDAVKAAKRGSAKEKMIADKKKKILQRCKEQLKKLELQETDRDENKTIALGTSKLNYLDPRISVAWCKKHDVPIDKIYNKTQRDKFRWAIDMATEDYHF